MYVFLALTSVSLRPKTVQMLNLELVETKRITVCTVWTYCHKAVIKTEFTFWIELNICPYNGGGKVGLLIQLQSLEKVLSRRRLGCNYHIIMSTMDKELEDLGYRRKMKARMW